MPVLYEPTPSGCVATYENGLKLVMRDQGWMGLGTCSARYEGEEGWVETGDSGRIEFDQPTFHARYTANTAAIMAAPMLILNPSHPLSRSCSVRLRLVMGRSDGFLGILRTRESGDVANLRPPDMGLISSVFSRGFLKADRRRK
jgi:hypothetical protein